ncbi:MAG: sugar nucleotide-binding protein, partial [Alphaproteobacteria bacterium]
REYPVPAVRPANSRLSLNRLSSDFQIEMPHWRDTLCHVLDEIFA